MEARKSWQMKPRLSRRLKKLGQLNTITSMCHFDDGGLGEISSRPTPANNYFSSVQWYACIHAAFTGYAKF